MNVLVSHTWIRDFSPSISSTTTMKFKLKTLPRKLNVQQSDKYFSATCTRYQERAETQRCVWKRWSNWVECSWEHRHQFEIDLNLTKATMSPEEMLLSHTEKHTSLMLNRLSNFDYTLNHHYKRVFSSDWCLYFIMFIMMLIITATVWQFNFVTRKTIDSSSIFGSLRKSCDLPF